MWISKKEYGRLVDENLELKRKNDTYVCIENGLKEMEEESASKIYYLGKTGLLITWNCYNELFIRATEAEEKLFKLRQELEGYKKLYTDELQKRIELAERVRKTEDKP